MHKGRECGLGAWGRACTIAVCTRSALYAVPFDTLPVSTMVLPDGCGPVEFHPWWSAERAAKCPCIFMTVLSESHCLI